MRLVTWAGASLMVVLAQLAGAQAYGLLAPAKTPKEIIEKLNTEVERALKDPEMMRELASEGAEPSPTTAEAFAKYLREDQERWKKVVKTAGIKVN